MKAYDQVYRDYRDTAAWLAARDNAGAWKAVLTADAEREVLDAAR